MVRDRVIVIIAAAAMAASMPCEIGEVRGVVIRRDPDDSPDPQQPQELKRPVERFRGPDIRLHEQRLQAKAAARPKWLANYRGR